MPQSLLTPRRKYRLREEFNGTAVNTNLWTVTDTGGNISVSGGNLVFAGGLGAPQTGDPALVSVPSWARTAGLTLEWQFTPTAANKILMLGFTDGTLDPSGYDAHTYQVSSDGTFLVLQPPNVAIQTIFSYAAGQVLWARFVCLATGALYYVSTDNKATWKLIWADATVTTTPLYAFIESYNAALTAGQARVYQGTPKPPAYTGSPANPTPAGGNNAVVNGTFDADTNWTKDPVWAIAAGVATASGSGNMYQLLTLNPNLWLQLTYDVAGYASGAVRSLMGSDGTFGPNRTADGSYTEVIRAFPGLTYLYFNATGGSALSVDNVEVRPLTLASTISLVTDPGTRNGIVDSHPTLTVRSHSGHWIWVDDEAAPTYGVLAYHDGTNAHLEKLVNGTLTSLIDAAAAYSAGAELRTVVVGTSVGLYYNGAQVGTTQTIADAWPAGGTRVCKFATLSTNDGGAVTVHTGVGV